MTLYGGQNICSWLEISLTPPRGSTNKFTLGEPMTPVHAITFAGFTLNQMMGDKMTCTSGAGG